MNPLIYKHDLKLAQQRLVELERRVDELESQRSTTQGARNNTLASRQEVARDRHIKRNRS